jgi:hypothetical protein
MAKTTSILLAQLAKAYALEKLRLDPRAGTAIGDEFWIGLAGQLVRRDRMSQAKTVTRHSPSYKGRYSIADRTQGISQLTHTPAPSVYSSHLRYRAYPACDKLDGPT